MEQLRLQGDNAKFDFLGEHLTNPQRTLLIRSSGWERLL